MAEVNFIDKITSAFLDYKLPADLKFILILLVADITLIYFPFLNVAPYKTLFSMPILFFIPGFCFLAAFFPNDGDLKFSERIVLSVGISSAIDILIGIFLHFSPFAVQLDNLILFLILLSLVLIPIAHFRRAMLRNQDMVKVQFYEITSSLVNAIAPPGNGRVDRILRVTLICALLFAVSMTIFIIIFPAEGEHFTEFFILGANKTAENYPDSLIGGQNYPMYIGIGNHENRNVTYTIEIWSLNTTFDPVTNTSTINYMDLGNRFSQTVTNNETTIIPYTLTVEKSDTNRIVFLLFNDTFPDPQTNGSDRINASYRDLSLRVSVQQSIFSGE